MNKKYRKKFIINLAFLTSIGLNNFSVDNPNDVSLSEEEYKAPFRSILDSNKNKYVKVGDRYFKAEYYKKVQTVESKKLKKIRIKDEKIRKEKIRKARIKREEELNRQKQVVNMSKNNYTKTNNNKMDNDVSNGTTYELTFYTAYCPTGCSGVTATGYNVSNTIYYNGYRVVAASPEIPFYTKMRITMQDGTVMNAIVLDRGGAIHGNILDVLVSNRDEAYRLGRQKATVQIVN